MAKKLAAGQMKPHIAGLLNSGRFSEALPLLKKACKANPKDNSLWLMQGVAQGATGAYKGAEESLRRSIKINARVPEAYYFLGNSQQSQGKQQLALDSYQSAIRLKPGYWEAHYAMARVLQQSGQLEKAIESFQKAIDINPSNPELHGSLALAWKALGKTIPALDSFRESLRLQPANAETWFNLGNLHHGHRELQEAESCYRKAVELKPAWISAHLALGRALLLQGEPEQAIDTCRKAGVANPGNPEVIAMEAGIFEQIGDLERAQSCLQPLIEAGSNDASALVTYAKLVAHLDNHEEVIALLESRLKTVSYDRDDARRLHFALADGYDAVEDYDRAFAHYQEGNRLKASRFDPRAWSNTIDKTVSYFSAEFLAKAGCATEQSKLPVFIVGMPRTGSTLLEQMLDHHSAVYGAGELPDIRNLVLSLPETLSSNSTYPECLSSLNQPVIDQVSRSHLKRLAGFSVQAARVIDKMPGNYLHLGLVQILFPGASVLHTKRDPVATCLSCFTRDLGGGASFSADLSSLGLFYQDYQRLMAHWKKMLTLPVHAVSYEELVDDPERVVKGVVEFCGLPWESQCLDRSAGGRVVNTPSYGQVRKALYKSSVKKWKHYEKHLGPLLESLGI